MERSFGHYVRILVDMELNKDLVHKILVERKGFAFFVDIEYEALPDFCTNCQVTGHHVQICKKLKAQDGNHDPQKVRGKAKIRPEWVSKRPNTKQPEAVPIEKSVTKSPARSKDDLALDNLKLMRPLRHAMQPLLGKVHNRTILPILQIRLFMRLVVIVLSLCCELESSSKSLDSVPSRPELAQQDIDFLKESWTNLETSKAITLNQEGFLAMQIIPVNVHAAQQTQQNPIVDDEGFQQVISKGTKRKL